MATETLATANSTNGSGTQQTEQQTGTETQQQTGTETQQQAEQKTELTAEQQTAKAEEDRRAALTDEQRKAEDDAKAEAEAKRKEQFGAPEKDYEFKAPEGTKPLKPELVDKLKAFAKERDLSQASAQALYDLGNETIAAAIGEVQAQIEQTKNDWAVQAKADKEFGGEKIDANLAVARRAMELGTPELKALLNDTGLGNHPEVIRWMYRVGQTLKQDEHVQGTRNDPGTGDARSFYPNSNMNP